MGDDAEAWLTSLKLCISETVAMRHPHPMKHIARMLVDPGFQESLSLPTAKYVQRHNLEERITNALGVAGFEAGQAVPSDMSRRLSELLLADAKAAEAGADPESKAIAKAEAPAKTASKAKAAAKPMKPMTPTAQATAEALTIRLLESLAAKEERVSRPILSLSERRRSGQRGMSRLRPQPWGWRRARPHRRRSLPRRPKRARRRRRPTSSRRE